MTSPSLTISYFTLHEAIRNRLIIFTLLMLICLFGMSEFIGEMVITERQSIQSASLGFVLRLFAIFMTCLFVITSMVREFNDKGFELILSLPVQRWHYYLGKFTGFAILSMFISIMVCLPLLFYSSSEQVLFWGLSLFCELLIMISVSLLCLFTFGNITIAYTVVITFYILSRTITAIVLLSNNPILPIHTVSQEFIGMVVFAIATVMPDLSMFTKSEWLLYGGAEVSSLVPIVFQTVIYILLLASASLFDLYRKNF